MTFEEWIADAKTVEAQTLLPSLEREPLKAALVQLHLLFCRAPHTVLDSYRRLDEGHLRRVAARRMEGLIRGSSSWTPPSSDPTHWTETVAAHLRALDELLYNTAPTDFGPPPKDLEEWKCSFTGAYVVPRAKMLDADLEGRPYLKRGTRAHRIVPAELAGIRTRPFSLDLHLGAGGLAAALFTNLQVTVRESRQGHFLVDDVSFDAEADTLDQQIDEALDAGCAAVVWPELTIDADSNETIKRILRARMVFGEEETPLQWLLTGSWHDRDAGGIFRNRATLIDGYGREIHRFDKLIPAQDAAGRFEDITAGDHIPILVTESGMIAFAICRDFCDRASLSSPYLTLPVDLFVVTSMGGETTMSAHQSVAAEVQAKTGALTFVVQQVDVREATEGELGFVLPKLTAPLRAQTKTLKVKQKLTIYSD